MSHGPIIRAAITIGLVLAFVCGSVPPTFGEEHSVVSGVAVVDDERLAVETGTTESQDMITAFLETLRTDPAFELILDREAPWLMHVDERADLTDPILRRAELGAEAPSFRLDVQPVVVAVVNSSNLASGAPKEVSAIADQLGLTLVVDTGKPESPIAWVSEELDLTTVVQRSLESTPPVSDLMLPQARAAVVDVDRVFASSAQWGHTSTPTRVGRRGSLHRTTRAGATVREVLPTALADIAHRLELNIVFRHPWPGVVHSNAPDITSDVIDQLKTRFRQQLQKEKYSETRLAPRTSVPGLFFARLRAWHQIETGMTEIQVKALLGRPGETRTPAPGHVCWDYCYTVLGSETCGWVCFNVPADKDHMSVNGWEAPPTPE